MYGHSISQSNSIRINAQKKIFILLLVVVLTFSTFILNQKKAEAALPIAAGGAAVGTYVLGALAVSAIAVHIGKELDNDELIEVGEIVKLHSDVVWAKSTDFAKQAWNDMYEIGVAGGDVMQVLPGFLKDQLLEELPTITTAALEILGKYNDATDGFTNQSLRSIPIGDPGYAKQANLYNFGWYGVYSINGKRYFFDNIGLNSSGGEITVSLSATDKNVTQYSSIAYGTVAGTFKEPWETWSNKTTFGNVLSNLGTMHLDFYRNELWEQAPNVQDQIAKDIPRMADAGLVLPVRDFEYSTPDGKPLIRTDTGEFVGSDGIPYSGDISIDVPVPDVYIPKDTTGEIIGAPSISVPVEGVPTDVYTGNPSIPVENVPPIPGGELPPTNPPTGPLPGTQPIIPVALLLGLFDLLRAILMYLARMFTFLVTLPLVTAIPIENPYFQWFRTATILGVQPYSLVMTAATFFISFAALKSIRRILP